MTRFYPASNREESATSSSSSLLSSVSTKAAVAATEETAGTGDFKDVAFSTPPPHFMIILCSTIIMFLH